MEKKPESKIPVLFQTLKHFNAEDTRFTKVKIWLMHLEENMNGSFFSREAVEKAIPSLANTPIMGRINEDTEDFEGHEVEMEITEDDVSFKNITVPYGVIPEFNNAHFEDRVGDDGVTRTYLTVEGLLWNKWEDAVNVLNSKGGITGQSMEIHPEYSGRFDDEFVFHFNEFKFDGACLLGDAVLPAMNNSTVETAFSDKVGSSIIQEKLAVYSRSIEEGGKKVDKKTIEEEYAKKKSTEDKSEEPVTEEPKSDEGKEAEKAPEKAPEKSEEPKGEEPVEEPKEEEKPSEPESEEDPAPVESEEKVIQEDTLQDARAEIARQDEERPSDVENIIVGDQVYSVDEAAKIITEHFALLKSIHDKEVESLFAQHAENLTDDEMAELKKDADTKDISDIETAIFATLGKKSFSQNKKKEAPNVSFSSVSVDTTETQDDPYGGALSKYLKK